MGAELSDATDSAFSAWQSLHPGQDLTGLDIRMRINRLDTIVEDAITEIVRRHGFSVYGDYQLAGALRRNKTPLRPSELADVLMVTRAGITGRLDRLENNGYVQREQSGGDARNILVSCTPLGRRRVDSAFAAIRKFDRTLLEPLTADEVATLARLLKKTLLPLDAIDR